MPTLGPTELIIVVVILLIIVGPGKLAGLGSSLGKSVREFRSATREPDEEVEEEQPAPEPRVAERKVVVEEERREIRRPTVTLGDDEATAEDTSSRSRPS